MSQFRQFWIHNFPQKSKTNWDANPVEYNHYTNTHDIPDILPEKHRIHVIEYSALEAAQKEIAELKDSNENIRSHLLSQTKISNQLLDEKEKLTAALKVAEDAMREVKYQYMRTYNTCEPEKIDELSPVMPLGLILHALAEIQKIKKGLG